VPKEQSSKPIENYDPIGVYTQKIPIGNYNPRLSNLKGLLSNHPFLFTQLIQSLLGSFQIMLLHIWAMLYFGFSSPSSKLS